MLEYKIQGVTALNIGKGFIWDGDLQKIKYLKNPEIERIIDKYVRLLRPDKVTVISDSAEDIAYVRDGAIRAGEEKNLNIEGHTVHFDGINDQGRDKNNTCIMVKPGTILASGIKTVDVETGNKEVHDIMDGMMEGKECIIRFFCLGPVNSPFSLCALQLTDSFYVAHSEDLLYRTGYQQFKNLNGSNSFFTFVHSSGKLDENGNSANLDKRRIYIDTEGGIVYTINNQYAGNSLGLKKLALRLAIYKSNHEDWLAEHMFIMGARPEGKDRTTYFAGAYPSACGKTSTAMIPGQLIVGDDIAYIRKGADGNAFAANVEHGIFGIIEDVNPQDDPVIYKTLTSPRELIFSNILVNDGSPYWLGMGKDIPDKGVNFSGIWEKGKKNHAGAEIPPAHKNARYTVRIEELENCDSMLNNPQGVPLQAIIYGGRDSDTSVPVCQSFDWDHGVFIGATIESETTAATIGKAGVRELSPMANLDFLSVPLGQYINSHFKFGQMLSSRPLIFATNYFLQESGKFFKRQAGQKGMAHVDGRTCTWGVYCT